MTVDPQPILIRKKVGTSVKPRSRKREQSLSSSDAAFSSQMTATTLNMSQISLHEASRKQLPMDASHSIAIEDYIRHKPQLNFHETLPTSVLSAVATSKAVDDAYDYLFKHLKGQCHGLNVITYPRVGKEGNTDESISMNRSDASNATRFAILAYIQPGTTYYDWKKIEEGLVRIFNETTIKKVGEKEEKWHLVGVVFELWATKPMTWDLCSGHF